MNSPHSASYRPPSTAAAPRFRTPDQRRRLSRAFRTGALAYDAARPGYPEQVYDLLHRHLAPLPSPQIVDVGAGTGKLTCGLEQRGNRVVAVEPSADMARVLSTRHGLPAVMGRAEALPLAASALDAAAFAQTWHWVDPQLAGAELDRVLRPRGVVLLVWNTLDVAGPWVLRLSRIMHSGDVLAEGFFPRTATPWEVADTWRGRWADPLAAQDLFALAATRSYWLRSGPKDRARLRGNLEWYLYEHSGLNPEDEVALPYRTDAFVLTRRHQPDARRTARLN